MKLEAIAKENLVDLAQNTTDNTLLEQLSNNPHAMVRRAVARNKFTHSDILERLALDPVLNVSYMAVNNPNCKFTREFMDTSNPCVQCKKNESSTVCENCTNLQRFYAS